MTMKTKTYKKVKQNNKLEIKNLHIYLAFLRLWRLINKYLNLRIQKYTVHSLSGFQIKIKFFLINK